MGGVRTRVWAVVAMLMMATAAGAAPQRLSPGVSLNLLEGGQLFVANPGDAFPDKPEQLATWLVPRTTARSVSIFGGAYWLHAQLSHDGASTHWVLDPNNTIIDLVEARLYGSDGSLQQFSTGYRAQHDYALHYGKDVRLAPGVTYDVLIRFESPYYASIPRFEVVTETAYQKKVLTENVVVLTALGAMAALAVFNFFVFLIARTRSHLYYAGQMLMGCWGWAMVFHVPAEVFGWHDLRLHYIPFYLIPAVGSLFCTEFLELRERQPLLFKMFRGLAVLSLALSPLAVFALAYAHAVATLLISAWIMLALVSGIRSLLGGFRPARFFVLAFVALLLPSMIILPGNLDLIPDLVENADMLTLLGAMLEGVLQAFALADRIRTINRERDHYSAQLVEALKVARTDVLTGIGNRFAFGLVVQQHVDARRRGEDSPHLLFVIDLDGLKVVNDRHGHVRGDELIKMLGEGLVALTAQGGACFRLGGDEFAIFAKSEEEPRLREGLAELELQLHAKGFELSGISYGVAHWGVDSDDPAEMIRIADHNMYQHKLSRKRGRKVDADAGRDAAAAP
jgi:diguanylate cyclase (GGDEF)-like protein